MQCWEVEFFVALSRKFNVLFSILFQIHFAIVHFCPIYHSFDQGIWFTVLFLEKELHSVPNIFCIVIYFVPVPVTMDRITRIHSNYFNGDLCPGQLSWFISSFFICPSPEDLAFWKIYFWLRQLKSFWKRVVSLAKFTILISWSPYLYAFNPRFGINKNRTYLSRNNA